MDNVAMTRSCLLSPSLSGGDFGLALTPTLVSALSPALVLEPDQLQRVHSEAVQVIKTCLLPCTPFPSTDSFRLAHSNLES
jgi:hypothetical protein